MVNPIAIPNGYTTALLCAPLEAGQIQRVERLLGHKGPPWLADIRRRYRGRGLAKELLQEAITAFERNGGAFLILGVNNPAAIRIYENLT